MLHRYKTPNQHGPELLKFNFADVKFTTIFIKKNFMGFNPYHSLGKLKIFDILCKLSPNETVCISNSLHEMSNHVFWGKSEKYFKMLTVENFTQHA